MLKNRYVQLPGEVLGRDVATHAYMTLASERKKKWFVNELLQQNDLGHCVTLVFILEFR